MSKWVVTAKRADFIGIAEQFGISPVLARIIRNRDVIGDENIRKFLTGSMSDLYDPFLMKDMDRAVILLREEISKGTKIRVIGDYDADGICASYILETALRAAGAIVDIAIPHRIRDGYGVSDRMVEQAADDGIGLLVTCDNGIAAAPQVELAHRLGIKVIVTDHHEVPFHQEGDVKIYDLPPADAVVDPKQPDDLYPFSGICGAVVAWKLACALQIDKTLLGNLLEPAAFATICDVMQLLDENRIIVKEGLRRMRYTRNSGLKALMSVNSIKPEELSAYHIGFVLGPCMNASGRLESAMLACNLWRENDFGKAVVSAGELKNLNDSRKAMTEENVLMAETQIEARGKLEPVLVIFLPECHESLAGIVAGRIRERYERPTIVLTAGEEGIKGSGRSIDAYDMFSALSECKELFTRFGGHKMAAGLSMDHESKVEQLREFLCGHCGLTEADFEAKVTIDVPMPMSYVTEEFVEELALLEPHGVGNPRPVFAQKEVQVYRAAVLGAGRRTLKLWADDGNGAVRELIWFGEVDRLLERLKAEHGDAVGQLFEGKRCYVPLTMTYCPVFNEYNGRRSIQMKVSEIL